MSNCKDLYDCNLILKCCRCKNILLKSNFNKNVKSKDGLQSQCKICVNDYNENYYNKNRDLELQRCKKYNSPNCGNINEHIKNSMKTDLNFKLACNLRSRTSKAFKAQNVRKANKTFDLLACSHSFF